jgi:hypothetical protein
VRIALACFAFIAIAAFAKNSAAQTPYRTYAPPSGPTLPHQLEYFRPQSGVLDNYNQFIAPRENLANQLRSMTQQQNRDFQSVQEQFKESDRIRQSPAAATGTAAGFMNFSHYFGGRGGSRSQPAQRPRQSLQLPAAVPSVGAGLGLGAGS